MSRWWRAYDDALNDPKVQRLPPHLFKTWFNLLCIASKYGGRLPSTDELAYLLRRRVDDVRRDVAALCARRLFDATESGVIPHNWDSRQFTSDLSTQRVRNHRKRFSNVSGNVAGNVTETPPETETETETETEKKELEPSLRSGELTVVSNVPRETKSKPKRAVKLPLPDGWQPNEAHRKAASELKLAAGLLESKAEDMRIWALSNGIRKIDWNLTFHGFLRRAANEGNGNGQGRPRAFQDDALSASRAADRLIEKADRGEFEFGPRPSLVSESGKGAVRLLSKG